MNVGKIKPFRAAFVREPLFSGVVYIYRYNIIIYCTKPKWGVKQFMFPCFLCKEKKHGLYIFLGHLVSKIDFFWK